jgi:hypothetical protein
MKKLIQIYWSLTMLLLADTILYLFRDISLPGHWADWMLFWCWFILTLIVILGNIGKKWAIGYGLSLLFLIMLSLLPMGVPFLTIVAFATESKHNSIKLNSRVRLHENAKSVIAIPTIEAVKNYYIFEQTIGTTNFSFEINDKSYRLIDVENVREVTTDNSESLTVEFQFESGTVTRTM